MIISNDIFKSYLCCEYKAFLKNNCVQGNNTDYRDFLSQRKNEFRIKAKKLLIKNFDVKDAFIKEFSNSSDLKRGKKLLLGATIKFRDIQAHVDALEKVKVNSALGSYSYRPYLFIPKNRICKQEKLLLAYIGYTLGLIQKNDIEHGFLLYGESFKRSRINLTKYHHTIAVLIEELRTILANDKQPKLLLNRHCPICEFQLDCDKEARSTDNLSLLRGMKEKEIKALNSKGIFTVTQFSFTFRPKKRRKRETNLIKRRYHALQALAIREQKLIVYGKPCIPTSSVCMYMDLETDPLRDFVYLIGLIISDNDDIKKYSFWADSPNEESKIVKEFLKVLNNFDEFILFHYGNIETKYIKSLLRADKGINKSVLEKILKNSINLLSIIYKHFYFPVYENSLKNIAGYIGIKWSEELSSGLKSIVVREQWEKSWSIDIKKILVKYNMEDCYATKSVLEYLCKVSSDDWKYRNKDVSKTLFDDDLKIRKGHMFGKNEFVIKDYNYINKCSYFDYQRKKIYVRTDKALKKRLNRNERKKRLDVKINKIIKIDCLHLCPNCGSKKLHRRGYVPSTLIDLKFFPRRVSETMSQLRD